MNTFEEAMRNSKPVKLGPKPAPQADHREIKKLFDIESCREHTAGVLAEPPPKRAWVVEYWIPQAEAGLLVSTGGTGKGSRTGAAIAMLIC